MDTETMNHQAEQAESVPTPKRKPQPRKHRVMVALPINQKEYAKLRDFAMRQEGRVFSHWLRFIALRELAKKRK